MAYCTICRTGVVWIRDIDSGHQLAVEVEPDSKRGTILIAQDGSSCYKIEGKFTLGIARQNAQAGNCFLHNDHKDVCLEARFDGI